MDYVNIRYIESGKYYSKNYYTMLNKAEIEHIVQFLKKQKVPVKLTGFIKKSRWY